jgi:hypothetical protein
MVTHSPGEAIMGDTDDWTERRITTSQALLSDDARVALGLWFDDGTKAAGRLDLRTIAELRRQLAICEAHLRSGTQPAQ